MKQFLIFLLVYCQLFTGIPAFAEQRILTADIVEGQDSGKNYAGNKGHFEKNVNGVSAYADAAGTSAVDGTGGAPTVTCTRTTSSPISGDGMLLITKDAANRQGNGCSMAFSIDSGDKATMQQIEFQSIIPSGTFVAGTDSANSDVIVQIYDVTNAAIIPVQGSGKLFSNSSTLAEPFRGYFQTAPNSTSYRLIWHVASTSASAYTVGIDNVKIKKSQVATGAIITDWTSFTPTGAWSSNTTYTGFYQRVGNTLNVKYRLALSGAPTSATLTLNLPTGMVADTTKLLTVVNEQNKIGFAKFNDQGIDQYHGDVSLASSTTLSVFALKTVSGSNPVFMDHPAVTQAVPFTWGNTDTLYAEASGIPIIGWGGTTQISDGYDGRVIVFKGYVASNQALTSGTTNLPLTALIDTVSGWSTDTYTVRSAGNYKVCGTLINSSGAGTYHVYVNGAQPTGFALFTADTTTFKSGCTTVSVSAGNTITIRANASVTTLGDAGTSVTIEKIQAPTSMSMTELISAGYSISADKTPAGNAAIDFDTKLWDTHNAVTTGGSGVWKFTAPAPGIYQMCVAVYTGSGGQTVDMYKNGVQAKVLGPVNSTSVNSHCTSVSLVAGDYISANPDGSITLTGAKNNNIYITRMK